MQTNIYHITQFKDNSAYLNLLGCDWRCRGCVRLLGWDSHLSSSDRKKLNITYPNPHNLKLGLDAVVKILKKNNVKGLYLGGGEPTSDPNIVKILKILKENGFLVKLVTNGEFLTDEIIDSVDEVTLSIKALDDEIHKAYTGVSNKRTLENFEEFYASGKIEMESIYIPEVVDCREILKIAGYIAGYNKNLRYRIDKFKSCGGYGRNAANEEIKGCLKKVKEILPNAYTFASEKRGTYAKCLYPMLN